MVAPVSPVGGMPVMQPRDPCAVCKGGPGQFRAVIPRVWEPGDPGDVRPGTIVPAHLYGVCQDCHRAQFEARYGYPPELPSFPEGMQTAPALERDPAPPVVLAEGQVEVRGVPDPRPFEPVRADSPGVTVADPGTFEPLPEPEPQPAATPDELEARIREGAAIEQFTHVRLDPELQPPPALTGARLGYLARIVQLLGRGELITPDEEQDLLVALGAAREYMRQ